MWSRYLVVCSMVACGDNQIVHDASPPDAASTPGLGPVIELGLLPQRPSFAPFAHSFETSIAAHGDTVVVAYINLGDTDPTTYVFEGEVDKRVAIATSTDRGQSFAPPIDPAIDTAPFTTDPVIRTGLDGVFWFATLAQTLSGLDTVAIGKSTDGRTWQPVAALDAADKEWIAVDATSVWIGVLGSEPLNFAYHRIDFAGTILGQALPAVGGGVTGMYVDSQGAHMAHLGSSPDAKDIGIAVWDGSTSPRKDGARLPIGRDDTEPTYPYVTTVSLGATPEGGQWIVRTVKRDGYPAIVLRVRHLPDEGVDLPISEPGAHAFLPTAIVDDDGRLRVIYYDTSGATGVLRTTRSLARDWSRGFERSTILDRDVAPGGRWVPFLSIGNGDQGGRRLREYIDVATTRRRIHVAWTAAPIAPSRVRTAYFDY